MASFFESENWINEQKTYNYFFLNWEGALLCPYDWWCSPWHLMSNLSASLRLHGHVAQIYRPVQIPIYCYFYRHDKKSSFSCSQRSYCPVQIARSNNCQYCYTTIAVICNSRLLASVKIKLFCICLGMMEHYFAVSSMKKFLKMLDINWSIEFSWVILLTYSSKVIETWRSCM